MHRWNSHQLSFATDLSLAIAIDALRSLDEKFRQCKLTLSIWFREVAKMLRRCEGSWNVGRKNLV
jgi:hypothetical protein